MQSLTKYFEQVGYKPKYHIGDRVTGKWNKIPFLGTVGNDTLVNETEGPYVLVHSDLPIKYDGKVYNIIRCKHKDIKKLSKIEP